MKCFCGWEAVSWQVQEHAARVEGSGHAPPQSLLPGKPASEMGASPVHSLMTQVLLLLLLVPPLTQPAGLRSRGLTASRASRV